MKKIKLKDKKFIEAYLLNGFIASRAYIEVHGEDKAKNARQNAWGLMQKPEVKEYLVMRQKEIELLLDVPYNEIMQKLRKIIENTRRFKRI